MMDDTTNGHEPESAQSPPADCEACSKDRFDYAWKWFAYHADQRVKMFNYMLVVVGIFAAAVTAAFDKGMPFVALALCATAAVLALVFSRLDRRNQELVHLGEDVLVDLEKTWFFKRNGPPTAADDNSNAPAASKEEPGILVRGRSRKAEDWHPFHDMGKSVAKTSFWKYAYDAYVGKHRFWLRATAYLIAMLFGFAAWTIIYRPEWARPTSASKCSPDEATHDSTTKSH
jgi:hypothetical protein